MAHAGNELRLVLARHFQLAALLLHFGEEIRVLDRQHGLCREGLQQIDGVLGKFAGCLAAYHQRADDAVGADTVRWARKPARTMTSSTGDDGSFRTSGIWTGMRRSAALPIAVSPMCICRSLIF